MVFGGDVNTGGSGTACESKFMQGRGAVNNLGKGRKFRVKCESLRVWMENLNFPRSGLVANESSRGE